MALFHWIINPNLNPIQIGLWSNLFRQGGVLPSSVPGPQSCDGPNDNSPKTFSVNVFYKKRFAMIARILGTWHQFENLTSWPIWTKAGFSRNSGGRIKTATAWWFLNLSVNPAQILESNWQAKFSFTICCYSDKLYQPCYFVELYYSSQKLSLLYLWY